MKMIAGAAALGLAATLSASAANATALWTMVFEGKVSKLSSYDLWASETKNNPAWFAENGISLGDDAIMAVVFDADTVADYVGYGRASYLAVTEAVGSVGSYAVSGTPTNQHSLGLYDISSGYSSESVKSWTDIGPVYIQTSFGGNDDMLGGLGLPLDLAMENIESVSLYMEITEGDEEGDLDYRIEFDGVTVSLREGAYSPSASAVPLPAPALMLGAGLAGLAGVRRLRKS